MIVLLLTGEPHTMLTNELPALPSPINCQCCIDMPHRFVRRAKKNKLLIKLCFSPQGNWSFYSELCSVPPLSVVTKLQRRLLQEDSFSLLNTRGDRMHIFILVDLLSHLSCMYRQVTKNCYSIGALYWQGLCPLVPVQRKVNANQYKVID